MTPVRSSLLAILAKSQAPLSPQELLRKLGKLGLAANKTTVYRQLEALRNFNIINEVNFADRTKRFELVRDGGHHHHLVCVECQRIEDVAFPTELESQEKTIYKKNKFKVLNHSLEFFGICKFCQRKDR